MGSGIAAMIRNMGLAGGFGAIAVGATPVVGTGVNDLGDSSFDTTP